VQRNVIIFESFLERAYQLGISKGVSIFGMNDQIGPSGHQVVLGLDAYAQRHYPDEANDLILTVTDNWDDGPTRWILVATPGEISLSRQDIARPILQPVQLKDTVDIILASDTRSDRIACHICL
jgi:hypothetical protein